MITQQWQGKKKFNLPYQSSTNKTILDHLLYLSIQSRLTEYKQYNNKKNKLIDSIVTGILSSHLNNKKSKLLYLTKDQHFNQRLYLCQFTNMIFGNRYDISPFQMNQQEDEFIHLKKKKSIYSIYFQNPLPNHCKYHRQLSCHYCIHYSKPPLIDQTYSTSIKKKENYTYHSILIQVIPLFLKISIDYFQKNNLHLPNVWYDLYLNLLTQAIIEAYLCDGYIGIHPILDIFSFMDNHDHSSFHLSWLLNPSDYQFLFPKTRSSFKTQVYQREQEFLIAPKGLSLQDHFRQLALKYPVETFDKEMREFIQTILKTMDIPLLEKDKKKMVSTYNPFVFKNDDGSLLMPDIDDTKLNHSFLLPTFNDDNITFKRRHSFDDIISHKKQKQY